MKTFKRTLTLHGQSFQYTSLDDVQKAYPDYAIQTLPRTQKILLENAVRRRVDESIIKALLTPKKPSDPAVDITFMPARVLMQDFTGVPAIVDLASMRDAMIKGLSKTSTRKKPTLSDAARVNPHIPVDLVIDHSVIVDAYGSKQAFKTNVDMEYKRNKERYQFLHWAKNAFRNFRVVPPGTGICHQVNLEYLSKVVFQGTDADGSITIYPDTLVGTDSHTTMVNGLSVLGWGVGGIEAEAVMLGQPLSMLIPDIVGFRLDGCLREGVTATDLVLTVTQILRKKGVVSKFVEFFGPGLSSLTLADRATIANMAPEYGATCGYFPIDEETLNYMHFTGRSDLEIELTQSYAREQGIWADASTPDPDYKDIVTLDLTTVEPSLAGPKRPQDKVILKDVALSCQTMIHENGGKVADQTVTERVARDRTDATLTHGDVVIAAITSCTNTSNPSVLVAAGLLARKAFERGLTTRSWVKTSLAPGSKVVTDYLKQSGLMRALESQGFYLAGYGCTTCIGNSGPLNPEITQSIEDKDLTVASVLSGNRNFEGRINPHVKANYLASPPLVVAYALAGTVLIDLNTDPLGFDAQNNPVYLKDIWPSNHEIQAIIQKHMHPDMFEHQYAAVFEGDENWQSFHNEASILYPWDETSTYVKCPPYFEDALNFKVMDIQDARILALLGDSITTDHISPAGSIKQDSPAGQYLMDQGVTPEDFNAYGTRRGNHEVMLRGTFANVRLQNEILGEHGQRGGWTYHHPSGDELSIYDAAMRYKQDATPLVVFAGLEYGTGSSRDWAAKGTSLLGVKAVIAESFERIHRSNLVGMGVLPLLLPHGTSRKTLRLKGDEILSISGLTGQTLKPQMPVSLTIHDASNADNVLHTVPLKLAVQTLDEIAYLEAGGILPYVLAKV